MKISCSIFAAGALLGCAASVQAELANAILAIVHDSVITMHEVVVRSEQTEEALDRQYGSRPAELEKKIYEVRGKNLEFLLDDQLILHEFKTAAYSLPESVIDDIIRERIHNDFGDRATLTKTLEAKGLTYEKFRQQTRERFIIQQLRLKNISSEIIISPHKVEAYYLAHQDNFKLEDEAKLRVIVLKNADDPAVPSAPKLAGELLALLDKGASFAELASSYSQGSQRAQGGDWGWWERSQLIKGMADVAFSLQVGKHSGVFSRSMGDDYWVYQYDKGQPILARHYGLDSSKKQALLEERRCDSTACLTNLPPPQEYYLLKLEESHLAHVKTLGEVRQQIEKDLLEEEHARLEKEWIDRLKKKTFVRKNF